jgi:hypothetical protein
MDIKGPAKGSKYKKVSELYHCICKYHLVNGFMNFPHLLSQNDRNSCLLCCIFQGGDGVVFQAASEFLPMIDEVIYLITLYVIRIIQSLDDIYIIFDNGISGLRRTGREN